MKYILPTYLLKELFKTFVPAFCGFGFLIMLGLTIQLLHKGLDIIDIRAIIPNLMIFACPDALPVAFLAATVMAYGRLSSNNEISAIRTSGIHLHVIVTPVIIISILLTFITFYLNAEVLPNANRQIKQLKETAVSSILSRRISTVRKKIVFEPYHIYIGMVEDNKYKNLAIIEYYKDFVTNILLAEEGMIVMSDDGNSLILTLKKGDFAKMNYGKPTEIPRIGTFDEMSFEIPINKKVEMASKKYKTLSQLYKERNEMNLELEKYVASLNYKGEEKFAKTAKKKLKEFAQKYNNLMGEKEETAQRIEILKNSIDRNKSKSENINNAIDTIENHIAVFNVNSERYEGSGEDSGQSSEVDKTLEVYIEKKKLKEEELLAVRNSMTSNKKDLKTANIRAKEINEQIEKLQKDSEGLLNYAKFEKIQKILDDIRVAIHKRLSASFLCITFVLIGIPLGILTRSGNILISFGVSFLLVILIYYPLSVLGLIFADDVLPIVPSVWGANGIIAILGIVLFRKSLTK